MVMDPWNDTTILPPPVNTILYTNFKDVNGLMNACKNSIKVLSKQSPLHLESALLSRFIYKFDKKFRNDIGYRILKKINTALKRYLKLNLCKDMQSFVDVIPKTNNKEDKYLPTRQMLEYVMIRIMTFSKIMIRICVCAKQASIYYMNRIKRGESHWMSLMPYALMCRIWSLSMVLLQQSCSWYSSLYPYLEQLQLKGIHLLPNAFTFPSNLGEWLDMKNLDNHGRFEWSHRRSIGINLNFAEDDEVNFDTILNYVKDINNEEDKQTEQENDMDTTLSTSSLKQLPKADNEMAPTVDFDQGVSISREYFQSFFKNQTTKNEKQTETHSADLVTSKATLDKFLSNEEQYRNEDNFLSLTKHLTFMQWQTLRTNLVNLSNTLSNNRKIERKFKKIWKEKCLDYI